MIPITLAEAGSENIIRKISGSPEVRKHLEDLGFVAGSAVSVVSEIGGNLILNVKNVRIAIGKEMAQKILI